MRRGGADRGPTSGRRPSRLRGRLAVPGAVPTTGPTHSSEANTAPYQDSEFLGQAFRVAAADGILGIVPFSDPVRRIRQDGTIIFPAIPASSIKPRTLYVGRGTVGRVAFFRRHGTVQLSRRERSGHPWCPRQRSRPGYLSSHRVLRGRAHIPQFGQRFRALACRLLTNLTTSSSPGS